MAQRVFKTRDQNTMTSDFAPQPPTSDTKARFAPLLILLSYAALAALVFGVAYAAAGGFSSDPGSDGEAAIHLTGTPSPTETVKGEVVTNRVDPATPVPAKAATSVPSAARVGSDASQSASPTQAGATSSPRAAAAPPTTAPSTATQSPTRTSQAPSAANVATATPKSQSAAATSTPVPVPPRCISATVQQSSWPVSINCAGQAFQIVMQVPISYITSAAAENRRCQDELYKYDLAGLARPSCAYDRLRVEITVSGPGFSGILLPLEISVQSRDQVTAVFPGQFGLSGLQRGNYSVTIATANPKTMTPGVLFNPVAVAGSGTATVQ